MTADPAVRARRLTGTAAPAITVVTDLVTAHLSWVDAAVDRVVVPSEVVAERCARDGTPADRYVPLGLPVAAEFCRPPLDQAQRRELKRRLGLRGEFLVVLTGGAEGSGRLRRCAAAILRQVPDVDVVVICGRNRSLRRRIGRLAERTGDGRLTALGFVGNMADWLRCADIVVGKAGPGTIAEATCCGAPLALTSFVPGQEKGNAEFVTDSGAGVYAPRPRQLAAEVGRLRRDPAALGAMRDASALAGRPGAAVDIARFIAELADPALVDSALVDSALVDSALADSALADPSVAGVGVEAGVGVPVGRDDAGVGWPSELLPALMAETAAMGRPLVFSVADGSDSDRRPRASASLRRLRRSGVLIRAALRDR
jgi:UDP-N-acetylglucosamine:LPS N-acetylglucosamine transferase